MALLSRKTAKINLTFRNRVQSLQGLFLVLPIVVGTAIFNLYPAFYSFYLSLTDWDLITSSDFIGLENYVKMFQDEMFYITLKNTAIFALGSIPLAMAAGLFLAILVNQKLRGTLFYRAIYFVPVVASQIAVAMIWRWLYNTDYGLLNVLLTKIGLSPISWLHTEGWAMFAVVIVSVWKTMGYNMILFLSGLQNIPEELYESAKIDGANRWAQFRNITLPLLSPTTFFILIISIIGSFQVFALLYVMTGGGPGFSTTVFVYYLWQNAFNYFKMGYGAALAFVLFVIIGLITIFQWRMSKRWVHYS